MPIEPVASAASPQPLLRVVCLCAQWCGTCRDYAAVFSEAQARFGAQARFTWVDIEDEADLLDGVDVENFPTLLLARGADIVFFGTLTPHPQTLARLVQGALAGELPRPPIEADVVALAGRLAA